MKGRRPGRRRFLLALPALAVLRPVWAEAEYPDVISGRALVFPRDHGSHPAFRTEWWYITGWVQDAQGNDFGVQVTFFRSRPGVQEENPSAFAPKQIVFAHAALADARLRPSATRPAHGTRRTRPGRSRRRRTPGYGSKTGRWSWALAATPRGSQRASSISISRSSRLSPCCSKGEGGFSRKGPKPVQASYYYSRPHLAARGTITVEGKTLMVKGQAWLDHEWSSEYLAADAAGWDWIGINLSDGGALMAFRIARKIRQGCLGGRDLARCSRSSARVCARVKCGSRPVRRWRSPRSGTEYPVAMSVTAGDLTLDLEPLMDDQELDARVSTGAIYWEGAVRAMRKGEEVGRGYLELTGYGQDLQL